jgi:hypothetical protein
MGINQSKVPKRFGCSSGIKPMIPHIRPEFVCDRLTNPDNQPICGVLDTNEVTRHGVLKTVLVHRIVAQAGTKL